MATFEIGDKIKSLRKIMGLSQDELTKKVGYKSRQFIADIEKYDNLSIKVINFNKRYDNPKMIDSSIEIVKM